MLVKVLRTVHGTSWVLNIFQLIRFLPLFMTMMMKIEDEEENEIPMKSLFLKGTSQ